ncbi:Cys-tRNA(Pro) deacylase [Marinibactrum halimedae]|uniref:Cys-tRNA(Pro)/Cys-tRNA(Cys) deacylase n=1 Tax=Marinibactrum halimedae TaxID=1444977 RepID=A0AA37TB76_9GAMM|nr:Cys-tRNA(Pro) deacylase [Marinibactrum halimedae]MCD9459985.1 Cys-tRNA(Pro) deacylase [Marinibactrum halimedae]GLS28247.1 Cys-tRNA(Pro)/Cys-tRNA(Cys) deacylase [Marinibactrum halimedae]
MTPAINEAKRKKIHHVIHDYEHDTNAQSYGEEAVEKLGVSSDQVFKTLVVSLSGASSKLAVAVVPVSAHLNLKLMAKACGAKKTTMADPREVERATGYVLGGVSPLGQKKRLPTVVDKSAQQYTTMYVSAGRRGLEIELSPSDLQQITQGIFAPIVD